MKNLKTILALVLILGLLGCSQKVTPTPAEATQDSNLLLQDYLQSGSHLRGIVDLSEEMKLSFPISGQIAELNVEEGDLVKAGDLLARLDTTFIETEVKRAQADLDIAETNLQKVMAGPHQALITEAESQVEAARSAHPLNSYQATAQAADLKAAQARLDYILAQPFPEDIAIAKAEVEKARIDLEALQARVRQSVLVAPDDGIVIAIYFRANEYASSGTPILQLGNQRNLVIRCELNEKLASQLAIDEIVSVTFDSAPGIKLNAKVISILPEANGTANSTFRVLLGLSNPPEAVIWGMTANVIIPED